MACFHNRCGERVRLINDNCTAVRNYNEFNHGLVISAEPLANEVLFEVKIDKKINGWSGSIEIGVTEANPDTLEFPACASKLRCGAWVMSGSSILKDGSSIVEFYGLDLDRLEEEDRVGVMRTSNAELVFYVNGESQGVAAENIPPAVYAVVDLYGRCVQVTITHPTLPEHNNDDCLNCSFALNQDDLLNSSFAHDLSELSLSSNASLELHIELNVSLNMPDEVEAPPVSNNCLPPTPLHDRIRFHACCGSLVKLLSNQRTAERRRPLDEFNNGVVMTHRPLRDDELFEIRLDRLVDKWSGSIEMGITTHNPLTLDFPATMTNMRTGTIMMSGCGILTNGKGTRREYGEFNLDELREGDRVGMMRRSNNSLHYFINGLDQGVAATNVPQQVWGVIDLYGMMIRVTIVDRDEREEQNLITRRQPLTMEQFLAIGDHDDYYDRLKFHTNCGAHADVINNGRTAHRPNATEDFNNAVVLTSRTLKPGELFEVRLDKMVTKWAGSIEIGVTTHSPTELEFPFTMTNVRSGTWMMTGNGVMHNGTTILDRYGLNLDRLHVGDRVGVTRKENGTLHFFVNGVDQGPAASNVPEKIYGVIDLYGQAAQATIQDSFDYHSPDIMNCRISNAMMYSDLRFHHIHGKNARITNNGQTALRPRAYGEFNDAIVFSNRPLRDGELFEIILDHMVDRWSGSVEIGVTAMRPEDVDDLPSTATDLDRDTWMLSGSAIMENGNTIKNGYTCDLDVLVAGARIGVVHNADKSLEFYLNGVPQGIACHVPHGSVYAVIDLYGQCAQVSLVSVTTPSSAVRGPQSCIIESGYTQSDTSPSLHAVSVVQPPSQFASDNAHKFADQYGKNIIIAEEGRLASRGRDLQHNLVFSASPLVADEIFEISIMSLMPQYAGSVHVGVTGFVPTEPANEIPPNIAGLPDCWYIAGNEVKSRNRVVQSNFCPNLDWLRVGDRIGLKYTQDECLKFYINTEEIGIVATNLPDMVYAVVELYGTCNSVRVTSVKQGLNLSPSLPCQDSLELVLEPISQECKKECALSDLTEDVSKDFGFEFHENHGRNIELSADKLTAKRVASYNQGIVVVNKPLVRGKVMEVRIDRLDSRWTSSIMCGVICCPPDRLNFPLNALGFKRPCYIVASDWVSVNSNKVKSDYGRKLDYLSCESRIGVMLTDENQLQIFVNGAAQGSLSCELCQGPYYAVFDLYGQCQQITLITSSPENNSGEEAEQCPSTSVEKPDNQQCEKADLESKEKETISNNDSNNLRVIMRENRSLVSNVQSNVGLLRPKCEYLKSCTEFKNSLLLPEEFFAAEEPICYCNTCYQYNNQRNDVCKGEPFNFVVPIGWVKFLLKNFSNNPIEKWHSAFYGASLSVIRPILDRGQPFTKEQLQWCNLINQPCEKDESASSQITFCPSIEQATSDGLLSSTAIENAGKTEVRAAFQLLVRPGSYSTGGGTCSGDTAEWGTKEKGAIALHGLMLRLQEC